MANYQRKIACENLHSISNNDARVVIQNSFSDIIWAQTIPQRELLGMARITHAQDLGRK